MKTLIKTALILTFFTSYSPLLNANTHHTPNTPSTPNTFNPLSPPSSQNIHSIPTIDISNMFYTQVNLDKNIKTPGLLINITLKNKLQQIKIEDTEKQAITIYKHLEQCFALLDHLTSSQTNISTDTILKILTLRATNINSTSQNPLYHYRHDLHIHAFLLYSFSLLKT